MNRHRIIGALVFLTSLQPAPAQPPTPRNYPYAELEGKAEEFHFTRNWRAYYWRQDFTLVVRDDAGKTHRVISREPTPWSGHRLGTTYTGLTVDWKRQPRVQLIGVRAIDRQPAEYYDLKLDPDKTFTAFILRVQDPKDKRWQDYYVNNWFHKWSDETDKKMLKHYANDSPHYTVYGYLGGIAAPFDEAGKALLRKYPDTSIYHGRIVPAKNEVGYELRVLHLLGRDKKTARYEIFHGNPQEIEKLDGAPPGDVKKKK